MNKRFYFVSKQDRNRQKLSHSTMTFAIILKWTFKISSDVKILRASIETSTYPVPNYYGVGV